MTVGITGHQELGSAETIEWIRAEMTAELSRLRPDSCCSCLAKGADQLFAMIALGIGLRLVAVIPARDYESVFSGQDERLNYRRLKKQAAIVRQLRHPVSTEAAFFEAGMLVLAESDVLIAVWDGLPAKGVGGTADIVEAAIESRKRLIHIHPLRREVRYYQEGGAWLRRSADSEDGFNSS